MDVSGPARGGGGDKCSAEVRKPGEPGELRAFISINSMQSSHPCNGKSVIVNKKFF
jgi:hypothetical protein